MSNFSLEEYKIQREYRENKRKEYLRRFQLLKGKIPLNSVISQPSFKQQTVHQKPSHAQTKSTNHTHHHQQKNREESRIQAEIANEIEENKRLKQQLQQIEAEERKKLVDFKEEISTIKEKYISEIKSISAQSQKSKLQTEEKIKKILQQMEAAVKKNEQIKKVNEELKKQLAEGESSMGKYVTEIKNQYSKKLNEFEKIFNSSNEKIQEMEKEFDEEEFVENALKNEDLLKTIQENASKSDEAVKILEDYKQLLEGKSQILKEINANIQMKQSELDKMGELEGKMKIIFEKMNQEKRTYVAQNQRMTKELMEVKELIMGFLNQAEKGSGAQEQQQ